MSDPSARVVLKDTTRPTPQATRPVRPDEQGTVDVYLRRTAPLADITSYGRTRPYLSRGDLVRLHGARAEDVAAVRDFARAQGLTVAGIDVAARRVRLGGSWVALGAAFGTSVVVTDDGDSPVYHNTSDVSLPASLAPAVTSVLGLDTSPLLRPHSFDSGSDWISVADVVARYQFPATTPRGNACDGTGETVALLEFNASFNLGNFQSYFQALSLPVPTIAVRADLLTSPPGDSEDSEAMLDALMVGLAAPGAHIVVWLCDALTPTSLAAGITAASADVTQAATVLSVSYGWFGWTSAEATTVDSAFQDAAVLAVTCISSSGDWGGAAGSAPPSPGDCPHALSVGGTVIQAAGAEVVWNDKSENLASSGGFSASFAMPSWQASALPAGSTNRGVPDVSAHADGYANVGYGTSAAAPLWAALIARCNQCRLQSALPRLGLVAPELYANPGAFNDITVGDNGLGTATGYAATTGWDAATGLGSPNGSTVNVLCGTPSHKTKPELKEHKEFKEHKELKELKEIDKPYSELGPKNYKAEVDLKPSDESWLPYGPPQWLGPVQGIAVGLDQVAQEVGQLRAFIRPEERPVLGERALDESSTRGGKKGK